MIMNQKGKGNDYFETPDYIFNQLNKIFEFDYDVACCAKNDNCKCPAGLYEEANDALFVNWYGRCFCNPPFSKKAAFIRKADKEVQSGNCSICVMILPLNCMDTKVFHDYIENKYHYEILQGRISFIDPETKLPKKGNNSGTVIVYFKKKIEV